MTTQYFRTDLVRLNLVTNSDATEINERRFAMRLTREDVSLRRQLRNHIEFRENITAAEVGIYL